MPLGGRQPCTRSIHRPDKWGGREVLLRRQPACLEAPHLAWRCRRARSRLAADDPAHRRIMPQAQGVVDILVSGKPPEHRLPQQPDQRMAAIPAGACIGQHAPAQGPVTVVADVVFAGLARVRRESEYVRSRCPDRQNSVVIRGRQLGQRRSGRRRWCGLLGFRLRLPAFCPLPSGLLLRSTRQSVFCVRSPLSKLSGRSAEKRSLTPYPYLL